MPINKYAIYTLFCLFAVTAMVIKVVQVNVVEVDGLVTEAATSNSSGFDLTTNTISFANSSSINNSISDSSPFSKKVAQPINSAGSLSEVLVQLQNRLYSSGGSAADWALLGKTHQFLGHTEDAEQAYLKALELGYDAQLLGTEQQAMMQQRPKPKSPSLDNLLNWQHVGNRFNAEP